MTTIGYNARVLQLEFSSCLVSIKNGDGQVDPIPIHPAQRGSVQEAALPIIAGSPGQPGQSLMAQVGKKTDEQVVGKEHLQPG